MQEDFQSVEASLLRSSLEPGRRKRANAQEVENPAPGRRLYISQYSNRLDKYFENPRCTGPGPFCIFGMPRPGARGLTCTGSLLLGPPHGSGSAFALALAGRRVPEISSREYHSVRAWPHD